MARNSYYDGTSGDDVVVGGSVGQQVLIDTKVAAAQLARINAEDARDSALYSAASALSSKNDARDSADSVEDIIPTGGESEMILVKSSLGDYDLKWTNTLENTIIDAGTVDAGYF